MFHAVRLLASALELTEDELREMHTRFCNSDWSRTLKQLERTKAMGEGVDTEDHQPAEAL